MAKFNRRAICKCGCIYALEGGSYLNGVRCRLCGLSHHVAIDIGSFRWIGTGKWLTPSTWGNGYWEVYWCGSSRIERIDESIYLLEKFNGARRELIGMKSTGLTFRENAGWMANNKRIAKLKAVENSLESICRDAP